MKLLAEKLAERGHNVIYLSRGDSVFRKKRMKEKGVRVILYPFIRLNYLKKMRGWPRKIAEGIVNRINYKRMDSIVKSRVGIDSVDVVYTYYELPVLRYFSVLKEDEGYSYKMIMRMAGLYWYEDILQNDNKKNVYENLFNTVDSVNFISDGIKKLTYSRAEEMGMNLNFQHHFVGDIGTETKAGNRRAKVSDEECFTVLCAGRFSIKQKRQDILVEAVRLMKHKKQIRVKLIGEGDNKNNILNLIRSCQLEDIISVHPFMKPEQLQDEMHNADLLCHPCDYEGLGKIIVESMTRGLPVMVSNVVPLNLYITNRKTGFLVENNPAAWAEKLDDIIENSHSLNSISEKAKEYAGEYFNADKNIVLYEDVFRKMINNGNK